MNALTFWRLLARAAPERVAIWAPEPVTYGALRARAEALAGALAAAGVRAGDRVLILLPLCVEEIAALFAVARLQAVFVPLHFRLPDAQIRALMADCGATVILTSAARGAAFPGQAIDALASHPAVPLPAYSGDENELAAVLYTSGSTGLPKGVMHRHRSLMRCAAGVVQTLGIAAEDRLLAMLPLSFHYGMSQVTSAFYAGASVALAPIAAPGDLLPVLNGVSVAAGVPLSWSQLLPALQQVGAPASLRLITIAGGAASGPLLDGLERALPGVVVVLLYGFTEALRATWLPPALYATKRGAMGVPVPDVALEVLRDDGQPCAPGEVGELVQRGALLGEGYLNQPEATAERWRRRDGEPMCYSGDLVKRDEDGVFWFVSRKDGVIKTGGFRVGPGEIEALVRGSGLVTEVVAFGVHDAERGQAIELAVEGGLPEAIVRWCRRNLPQWMAPRRVHALTLPRRPNGKIDRAATLRLCGVGP